LQDTLKVYQVRYTEYGTRKWCYTSNFTDCYPSINEAITGINRLKFTQEFYDKLWIFQQTNLQSGQKQT
jgi:hypothetical protein